MIGRREFITLLGGASAAFRSRQGRSNDHIYSSARFSGVACLAKRDRNPQL
jgi:hypothetical protein